MLEHILYTAIVILSAFSIGAAGFAAILDWQAGGVGVYRAINKVGYMIVVGLILWLVIPTRTTEFSIPTVIYMIGLLLGGLGAIGVTFRMINDRVEMEATGDTPPEGYNWRKGDADNAKNSFVMCVIIVYGLLLIALNILALGPDLY